MNAIPVLESIAPLVPTTDVWFLDIWGVLHNGVRPFAGCVEACRAFRQQGGKVMLVSNSPRPRDGVIRQLEQIGVDPEAYDDAITSGDVSRRLIANYAGQPVWHLGPERDLAIYNGLGVTLAAADVCNAIVCTGLFDDERETPDDYAAQLSSLSARGVQMICVNPDLKVERGGRIIYCAGALAEAYERMGGHVAYAGKPFAPIYDAAFARANELAGRDVPHGRVLAIGDGIGTDIAGAAAAGIRSVYVASPVALRHGVSLAEAGDELFASAPVKPVAMMRALTW